MPKRILIEHGDSELELITEKELEEMIQSDIDCDGFHGFTVKGYVETKSAIDEVLHITQETLLEIIRGADISTDENVYRLIKDIKKQVKELP